MQRNSGLKEGHAPCTRQARCDFNLIDSVRAAYLEHLELKICVFSKIIFHFSFTGASLHGSGSFAISQMRIVTFQTITWPNLFFQHWKMFSGKISLQRFSIFKANLKTIFFSKKFFYKISDNAFSYTGSDLKDTEERHTKLSGTKKFNILGESLV